MSKQTHQNSFLNTKFFYIVFVNSIFYYFVAIHYQMPSLQGFKSLISLCVFNFAFFYLLCFVALKIHYKLLVGLQNLLVIMGVVLGCVSIFLLLHFNSLLNAALAGIILNTNLNESREFMEFYFDTKTFLTLFVFVAGSVALLYYKKHLYLKPTYAIGVGLCSVLALCAFIVRANYSPNALINKNEFLRTFDVFYSAILGQSAMIAQYKELHTILNTQNGAIRGGGIYYI